MTREQFDKLDKLASSIKIERDKLKIQREERIAQTNAFFDSIDAPLKEQYYTITEILGTAKVEE